MSASTWHTVSTAAISICWSLVGLVWVVGTIHAARRAPAVRKRTLGRAWVVMGAVIAWAGLRLVPDSDWHDLVVHSQWIRWPGLVLLAGSTAFTIWARLRLGAMWSANVVARVGHELRTDGPYAIVRHPIYTGFLGMALGSALLDGIGRWTVALVLLGLVVLVKVHAEERLMTELFPREYERYRRRVPALVPLARRR